jgi:hypothetical protein
MILFAPRCRSAYIICKFLHVHQRAMNVTMKTKLVPGRNYFLWYLRIPFRNFTHKVNAGFGIPQLFKDGINRPSCESTIQITVLMRVGQIIIMTKKREHWLVINT